LEKYKEYYNQKVVLVTGGAGAIGSNLSRVLADLGAKVVIVDDLSSGKIWTGRRLLLLMTCLLVRSGLCLPLLMCCSFMGAYWMR